MGIWWMVRVVAFRRRWLSRRLSTSTASRSTITTAAAEPSTTFSKSHPRDSTDVATTGAPDEAADEEVEALSALSASGWGSPSASPRRMARSTSTGKTIQARLRKKDGSTP